MSPALSRVSVEARSQRLVSRLFPHGDGLRTYAVLDGASMPDLLDHLYAEPRPEFVCLYRGPLAPDMAEVAPYLVNLKPGTAFTDWLFSEAWGKHCGIFALAGIGLDAVRTHFRRFLMVKDPAGQQLYFRFYDPRVLPVFLATCNPEELAFLFGPLLHYACEAEEATQLLVFSLGAQELTITKSRLVELDRTG